MKQAISERASVKLTCWDCASCVAGGVGVAQAGNELLVMRRPSGRQPHGKPHRGPDTPAPTRGAARCSMARTHLPAAAQGAAQGLPTQRVETGWTNVAQAQILLAVGAVVFSLLAACLFSCVQRSSHCAPGTLPPQPETGGSLLGTHLTCSV